MTGPLAPDTMVHDAATKLLNCFCSALAELPNPPVHCAMRIGVNVAQDLDFNTDICCQGLAWVRVASIYDASETFPIGTGAYEAAIPGCGIYAWGVTLEMGVYRCAPSGTDYNMPTDGAWLATQTQLLNDAKAMRAAICCFYPQYDPYDVAAGNWSPVEVQGGCTGGTMTINVRLQPCDDC